MFNDEEDADAIREVRRGPMYDMPEFTQEDLDLAMEDMFEVLANMQETSKKEAYNTVGKSWFKEQ